MHAPLTEFEAQVALAEMIVKLLAKEDSTKPRVSPFQSPLRAVIRCAEGDCVGLCACSAPRGAR